MASRTELVPVTIYTLVFRVTLKILIIDPVSNLCPEIQRGDKGDLANDFCKRMKQMTSHGDVLVCQGNGNNLKFVLKTH